MPDLKSLKQSVIDYGNTLKQRAANPLETLNTALQSMVKASPEELASQLLSGGVGHISSSTMFKLFPEFEKSIMKEGNNLIPLYHGTSKDKDFKSLKDSPRGIWLTKDPGSASAYAKENDAMNTKYNPDTRRYEDLNTSSRVIPVYADVRNPYTLTEADSLKMKYAENYAKAQKELMNFAISKGHDAIDYGGGVIAVASSKQLKSSLSNK